MGVPVKVMLGEAAREAATRSTRNGKNKSPPMNSRLKKTSSHFAPDLVGFFKRARSLA